MQISRLSLILVLVFSNYEDSHLGWCGLQLGTKWQKYCNKQVLICNKLHTVPNFRGDTPSHKATAVQAQVLSEKSEN